MGDRERVVYIGCYTDEKIVRERGMPAYNTAASNRIRRLGEALRSGGRDTVIVSSACSRRIRFNPRMIYPSRSARAGKVPLIYCAALGLPFIGVLAEPFFILSALARLCFRRKVSGVIVYNFSPALLPAALLVRFCLKIPLILDLEDISYPKATDWLPPFRISLMRQAVFVLYMRAIIYLANKIILPTLRFVHFIPKNKPYLAISGCMQVLSGDDSLRPGKDIREESRLPQVDILLSGRVDSEKEVRCFLDAVKMLDESCEDAKRCRVHICGYGPKMKMIKKDIEKISNINIKYYGFVNDKEYGALLSQADLCVVLQDPRGRYDRAAVPSKAYEYLASGKAVITTDMGDLGLLPRSIVTVLEGLCASSLCRELRSFIRDPERMYRQGMSALEYSLGNFDYSPVGKKIADFVG